MKTKLQKMWGEIDENHKLICDFLSGKEEYSDKVDRLLNISIKMVIGELYLYKKAYEKYVVTDYDTEDYVNMLIESMSQDLLSNKEDLIDKMRSRVWGHIKSFYVEILNLFKKSIFSQEDMTMNEKDRKLATKCLTAIYVESILRQKEIELNNDKGRTIKT